MKKQIKWKLGGRPRQKSSTKRWLLEQCESIGGKEKEKLESPPIVPPNRKKEV